MANYYNNGYGQQGYYQDPGQPTYGSNYGQSYPSHDHSYNSGYNSQYQQQNSYYQPQDYNNGYQHQQPQSNQEGDRGLLGAMGGGLAGGAFGHKQHHGFLGTIGGAILGSMAEDALKKKGHQGKHGKHHKAGSQGFSQYTNSFMKR